MILHHLARRLGYDLVPRRKLRAFDAQLVHTLHQHGVEAVVDVGANRGQYVLRLREAGWQGPILSLEPIPELQRELEKRAASDPAWEVLPAMAAGAVDGEVAIEVSAESDMSSVLPQSPLLQAISPSSSVRRREVVPQRRLDGLLAERPWRRLFVKVDVQGAEPAVVEGLADIWDRVAGLQLELALLPLYEGERPWLEMIEGLAARGFTPYLLFPGYFARSLGRQVQLDAVFYRTDEPPSSENA